MNAIKLTLPLCLALACGATQAWAGPVLGSAQSFAALGGSAVTNTGPTTLSGNLGVSPGSSITGSGSITFAAGSTQSASVSAQAQTDAQTAYNALNGLAVTSDLSGQDLGGLTLTPGVYFFSSSAQLTGQLTLNGQGNANAAWVFKIGSTLTTASASDVLVENTGAGAGVYWDVGSSATLGTTTAFEGNILAVASITLNTSATIGCGRALANTGALTLDTNTIDATDCTGTGGEGSNGFSGGVDLSGTVATILPSSTTAVPEPGTLLLFGFGLAGLFGFRKKFSAAA